MEGSRVSTPIAGLSGIDLKRSFLMSLQHYRSLTDKIIASNVPSLTDNEVERLVHDLIVSDDNLDMMCTKIEGEANGESA